MARCWPAMSVWPCGTPAPSGPVRAAADGTSDRVDMRAPAGPGRCKNSSGMLVPSAGTLLRWRAPRLRDLPPTGSSAAPPRPPPAGASTPCSRWSGIRGPLRALACLARQDCHHRRDGGARSRTAASTRPGAGAHVQPKRPASSASGSRPGWTARSGSRSRHLPQLRLRLVRRGSPCRAGAAPAAVRARAAPGGPPAARGEQADGAARGPKRSAGPGHPRIRRGAARLLLRAAERGRTAAGSLRSAASAAARTGLRPGASSTGTRPSSTWPRWPPTTMRRSSGSPSPC